MTLATLPHLPPTHHWRRPIIPEPRLAKWYAAPTAAPYLASTETGTPQAGDLVLIDKATHVYLPEPAELTEARAVLIHAGLLAPGDSVGVGIRQALKAGA